MKRNMWKKNNTVIVFKKLGMKGDEIPTKLVSKGDLYKRI